MGGLGRAAYAEERRVLRDELLSRYNLAAGRDPRTVEGRLQWGLRVALDAMGVDPSRALEGVEAYDRHLGQVGNETDVVDVGIAPWDGDDRDEFAVRLEATDGADDTTARIYLRTGEARELATLLHRAAEAVDAAWSDRAVS